MTDISGGRLAGGSGPGATSSPQSCDFSENKSDASSQAERSSSSVATPELSNGEAANGALYNKSNAGTVVEAPLSSEIHTSPMGVTFAPSHHRTPTGFPAAGCRGERRRRLPGGGQETHFTAMNAGRGDSFRDNFTLPTESWARRSSRWRGLDISGTGEGGKSGGLRSPDKQWVRRGSMGTTMRFDDRRPDLRRGSESHRPQTAPPPPRGLGEVEGGRGVAKRRGRVNDGAMSHRLPSNKNG